MTFTKKANNTRLPQEDHDRLIRANIFDSLRKATRDGILSREHTYTIDSLIGRETNYKLKSKGHIFKPRISLDMAVEAYSYLLETDVNAKEALDYIKRLHNLSDDYIEQIKYNAFHKNDNKRVVSKHDNHPVQKAMKKDGTLDRISLKNSNNPNQQLLRLHRQKTLHQNLENVKQQNLILRMGVDSIQQTLDANNITISNKDKAKHLRSKQYTIKQIASYLNVSPATIKRWLES